MGNFIPQSNKKLKLGCVVEQPFTMSISNGKNVILTIYQDSSVEYLTPEGEVKIANDIDSIFEAFRCCVINYTGENIPDSLISTICKKIEDNDIKINQLGKIEKSIRKRKLEKLNQEHQ